jgi:hypothetical protein
MPEFRAKKCRTSRAGENGIPGNSGDSALDASTGNFDGPFSSQVN